MDVHSDVLLHGGYVDLVVVLVRPNKANVDDARSIIDGHHKTVLIAPNIEDHTIIAHHARIAVHISDVGRRFPGGAFGITIPRLEGLLSIGVLFPKKAQRFEGDNAHVDIVQRSRIGNNLRMERRTPAVSRAQWLERRRSGSYWVSAPLQCTGRLGRAMWL